MTVHTLFPADGTAKPALRVVEQAQAGTYEFQAPEHPKPREPAFRPAGGGAVYLGTGWLGPDIVSDLLRLFQREANRTGDWALHDDLQAARDGIVEPPPEAA